MPAPSAPINLFTAGAAAQFADPPAAWADVSHWKGLAPPVEFDVELWGAVAQMAALKICGAVAKAAVIVDDTIDGVTAAANTLTITGHALRTGDGPVRFTTDGALPGGLAVDTDYWIGVVDANTVKVFASREALLAGGSVAASTAIDLTSAGSGTNTLVDTASTERLHWMSAGLLGPAYDGAVVITAAQGYVAQVRHRARALAYALIGTLSSGSPNATIQLARPL